MFIFFHIIFDEFFQLKFEYKSMLENAVMKIVE
jgi:hypothetical protein